MLKITSKISNGAWAITLATVAFSIAAYSTHLNFRFGAEYYGGQDVLSSNIFGAGFVVADVAKYILVASIAWAWRKRRYVSALAYIVLIAAAAIMSVAAMTSVGLQGQEEATGMTRARAGVLVDLKAERAQLLTERAAMGTVEPPAAIEARIAAHRHDRRWTTSDGCTQATASASRRFCGDYQTLFSQLAGAQRAEQLGSRIDRLNRRIQGATVAETVTDQRRGMTVLGALLGIDPATATLGNLIALAALIEALGVAVWGLAAVQIAGVLHQESSLKKSDPVTRRSGEQKARQSSTSKKVQSSPPRTPATGSNVTSLASRLQPRKSGVRAVSDNGPSVPTPNTSDGGNAAPLLTTLSVASATAHSAARVQQARIAVEPCPVAFWDSCTTAAKGARLPASELYGAYIGWCQDLGVEPVPQLTFGKRLTVERKPRRRRAAAGNVYVGIKLRNTQV